MDWLQHFKKERAMWIGINDSINELACGPSAPHSKSTMRTRILALDQLIRIGEEYDNDREALYQIYKKTANETYDKALEMANYVQFVIKMPRSKNETN